MTSLQKEIMDGYIFVLKQCIKSLGNLKDEFEKQKEPQESINQVYQSTVNLEAAKDNLENALNK